jgi:hypothetical protein
MSMYAPGRKNSQDNITFPLWALTVSHAARTIFPLSSNRVRSAA